MSRSTFTPKDVTTVFTIRNTAPDHKNIKVFGQRIGWGREYDLLTIPNVSEADIRHSLLKGELKRKGDVGEYTVVSSTIDLTQYDAQQTAFLTSVGITTGLAEPVVAEDQVYYVGKHGNDSNDGLTLGNAFLTFGAAVAAATAQTPSSTNVFVIKCFDAGTYTENIVLVPFVSLHAPSITIRGQVQVASDTETKIRSLEVDDSLSVPFNVGIVKLPPGAGTARFEADVVTATNNSICAANGTSNGILIYEVKSTFVENGIGIGDSGAGVSGGHVHLQCEDIYVTGTGIAILKAGTGSLVGYAAHILELGGGIGNGTAIYISSTGEIDLQTTVIDCNTAYTIAPGSNLRLVTNKLVGAVAGLGAAYITIAGYVAGTPADWAASSPTSINDTLDRLASAVAGLLGGPIP